MNVYINWLCLHKTNDFAVFKHGLDILGFYDVYDTESSVRLRHFEAVYNYYNARQMRTIINEKNYAGFGLGSVCI